MTSSHASTSKHPIYDRIKQVDGAFEQLTEIELNENHLEDLAVVRDLWKFFCSNLNASTPRATPLSALEAAKIHIEQVKDYLDQFISQQDQQSLNEAIKRFQNLAERFSTPFRFRDGSPTEEYIDRLTERLDGLAERLNAFTAQFDESSNEATNDIMRIESALTSLDVTVEALRSEASSRASEIYDEFQSKQSERSKAFSELLDEQRGRFDDLLADSRKKLDDQFASSKTSTEKVIEVATSNAQELMDDLLEIKSSVDRTAGLIGSTALVGKFHKEAKDARVTSEIFRYVAGVFAVIAAVFVGWTYFSYIETINTADDMRRISGWDLLLRSQVALFILFPAGFFAFESRSLKKTYENLKTLELLMSSFAPFTDDVDDETKAKLMELVMPGLFRMPEANQKSSARSNKEVLEFVQQIVAAVKKQ